MNRFSELGKLKTDIMLKLIDNDNIVKCLINNETNFQDIALPENYNKSDLLYKQIFPYKMIPTDEVQNIERTYITMAFDFKSEGKDKIKVGSIYFFIITHINLLRTDYGMIRYDYLLNQIDETFNGLRGLGISKLSWNRTYDFSTENKNYIGCAIEYKNTNFQ